MGEISCLTEKSFISYFLARKPENRYEENNFSKNIRSTKYKSLLKDQHDQYILCFKLYSIKTGFIISYNEHTNLK